MTKSYLEMRLVINSKIKRRILAVPFNFQVVCAYMQCVCVYVCIPEYI